MIRTPILIVGGGIHGSFLAAALSKHGQSREHEFQILDPADSLLRSWKQVTKNTGMQFLRSSNSHSLAPNFHGLRRFAKNSPWTGRIDEAQFMSRSLEARGRAAFLMPYNRPNLSLFNAHSDELARHHGLQDRLTIGRLLRLAQDGKRWRAFATDAQGRDIEISAATVILALGFSAEPFRPDWAPAETGHVLDDSWNLDFDDLSGKSVAIIGGGLSAVQTAVRAVESNAQSVCLISPHSLRVARFDFDPCYIGPKCGGAFAQLPDPRVRTALAKENRLPGTVTAEMQGLAKVHEQSGRLRVLVDEVQRTDAGTLCLAGGGEIRVDTTILATGYEPPKASISFDGLRPRSVGGFPLLDESLEWLPGLFVTGALALNRIGPPAPNLIGAHLAARRILPSLGLDFAWRADTETMF